MYTETFPVIETPLSSAECIHYMVMQCWGDTIRVFPAVPDEWKDISFGKLLAEGAFEVSGRWSKGKTEYVVIKSLAGAPLKIMPNLLGPLEASGERNFSITEVSPGVYKIDLKQGESVLLYTGNQPEEIGIGPVGRSL
ncbi:glycoside hydrolase family 95-like protein [Paenibacillus oryzisoli]|uniref:glycoside hydrolase family 95-like protein n=1 Tax=Paenibacillus oryzisoli TaxID=1850517 RepID=UPI003D2A751A